MVFIRLRYITGSYTEGLGIDVIRQDVADYITRRDGGIECEADDVFLSSGAADAFTVGLYSDGQHTLYYYYFFIHLAPLYLHVKAKHHHMTLSN